MDSQLNRQCWTARVGRAFADQTVSVASWESDQPVAFGKWQICFRSGGIIISTNEYAVCLLQTRHCNFNVEFVPAMKKSREFPAYLQCLRAIIERQSS